MVIVEKCRQIPEGEIYVMATHDIQIHFYDRYKSHELMSYSPADVFDNYVRDCLSYDRDGLSFVDYICVIVDNII